MMMSTRAKTRWARERGSLDLEAELMLPTPLPQLSLGRGELPQTLLQRAFQPSLLPEVSALSSWLTRSRVAAWILLLMMMPTTTLTSLRKSPLTRW